MFFFTIPPSFYNLKPEEEQPISIYHYHHLLATHRRGHESSSDLREVWISAVIDALVSAADWYNSLFIKLIILVN